MLYKREVGKRVEQIKNFHILPVSLIELEVKLEKKVR